MLNKLVHADNDDLAIRAKRGLVDVIMNCMWLIGLAVTDDYKHQHTDR